MTNEVPEKAARRLQRAFRRGQTLEQHQRLLAAMHLTRAQQRLPDLACLAQGLCTPDAWLVAAAEQYLDELQAERLATAMIHAAHRGDAAAPSPPEGGLGLPRAVLLDEDFVMGLCRRVSDEWSPGAHAACAQQHGSLAAYLSPHYATFQAWRTAAASPIHTAAPPAVCFPPGCFVTTEDEHDMAALASELALTVPEDEPIEDAATANGMTSQKAPRHVDATIDATIDGPLWTDETCMFIRGMRAEGASVGVCAICEIDGTGVQQCPCGLWFHAACGHSPTTCSGYCAM